MQGFIRRIEVEITYTGLGGSLLSSEHYISTGLRDGLAISFTVSKNLNGSPNESTIVISNMSPETRKRIVSNVEQAQVHLYANYQSEPRCLLAFGALTRAWPEKEGVNNKMTLSFLDGVPAVVQGIFSKHYDKDTDISKIVIDLAQSFSEYGEVKVDESKVKITGTVGARGLTVKGRTSDILNQLAKDYAFSWSIQNGVFQAYADASNGTESSRKHYEISLEKLNLIKASPQLGDKYMNMIGMKIEAILNALVQPGDIVELSSSVYPDYSGSFQCHNIEFTGDTMTGGEWKMTIDSKTITRS